MLQIFNYDVCKTWNGNLKSYERSIKIYIVSVQLCRLSVEGREGRALRSGATWMDSFRSNSGFVMKLGVW